MHRNKQKGFVKILIARVNNKRGECLTPYSPVIDDCAEVKRLLFRVTYRLASIFSHLTTKAIPDKGSAFNSMFKFTTKSITLLRKEVWLLTLKITLGRASEKPINNEPKAEYHFEFSLRRHVTLPLSILQLKEHCSPYSSVLVQSSNILEDSSRCS